MTHPDNKDSDTAASQSGSNDSFKTAIDIYYSKIDHEDIVVDDRLKFAGELLSAAETFDEACVAWHDIYEIEKSRPSLLATLFDEFFVKAGALMRTQDDLWSLINLQSHCSGGNYEIKAFEAFLRNTDNMDAILDLYRLVIEENITSDKVIFLKAKPVLDMFFNRVTELQALEESEK